MPQSVHSFDTHLIDGRMGGSAYSTRPDAVMPAMLCKVGGIIGDLAAAGGVDLKAMAQATLQAGETAEEGQHSNLNRSSTLNRLRGCTRRCAPRRSRVKQTRDHIQPSAATGSALEVVSHLSRQETCYLFAWMPDTCAANPADGEDAGLVDSGHAAPVVAAALRHLGATRGQDAARSAWAATGLQLPAFLSLVRPFSCVCRPSPCLHGRRDVHRHPRLVLARVDHGKLKARRTERCHCSCRAGPSANSVVLRTSLGSRHVSAWNCLHLCHRQCRRIGRIPRRWRS